MANLRSGHLTLSAMFIALGVLLPVLFHAVGLGSMFLPLFWPVAAALFFLPVNYALIVAVLTPILSFFLTGMPPISPPILQLIIGELLTLTLVGGLLYRLTKLGSFWVLLIALTASRIVLFLMAIPFASVLGIPPGIASTAFVIKGAPGIACMLLLVPLLIYRLKREKIFGGRA